VTAFDTLFWLLIVMLGVVAYAIEAGIATRHRTAVLGTMFSVVGAILYIMLIGDDNSFGRAGAAPGVNAAAPVIELPKLEAKAGELADLRPPGWMRQAVAPVVERNLPSGPFSECENCPSMIAVQPGSYSMGSAVTEPGRRDSEGPVNVTIAYPLGVGRFEVTRDQFAAFVEDAKHSATAGCLVNARFSSSANWQNPGFEQAGNHPVVCIAWRDARAYVAWLSKRTKKSYRLLSEAEWEYMARAGVVTAFAFGDKLLTSHGNFNRMRDGTIPIGYSGANDFGVHDVHGNAWELVDDCWNADLGLNDQNGRPISLRGDCSQRVIRGGGWESTALQSRLAARGVISSNVSSNTVGFRVARVFD
jgi:formylglycine-generating enzyme required for sulfatase activity